MASTSSATCCTSTAAPEPDARHRDELAGTQRPQRPGVGGQRPVGGQVAGSPVAEQDVDPHDVGVGEPLAGHDVALGGVDRHPVVGAGDDDRAQHGGHQHEEHADEQPGVAPRRGAQP